MSKKRDTKRWACGSDITITSSGVVSAYRRALQLTSGDPGLFSAGEIAPLACKGWSRLNQGPQRKVAKRVAGILFDIGLLVRVGNQYKAVEGPKPTWWPEDEA